MTLESCVKKIAYKIRLVLLAIYEWKDAKETTKLLRNETQAGLGNTRIERGVRRYDGHCSRSAQEVQGKNLGSRESRVDNSLHRGLSSL